MSEPVKPALTEKEWAKFWGRRWHIILESENGERVLPATKEAAVALALYGQPFGFTREDLWTLFSLHEYLEMIGARSESREKLRGICTRVAALLPPSDSETMAPPLLPPEDAK